MKQVTPHTVECSISSKIFEKARYLFNHVGVRNTTMDDLAKELGISKKTLYQQIKNKEDLVRFCIVYDLQNDEQAIDAISKNTENAIEELLLIAKHVHKELQLYNPAMLMDISKFYPECWSLIDNHIQTFAKENIQTNLKKGIRQGLYRKDINIEIVSSLQLRLSMMAIDNKHQLNIKPVEIYFEILKYNLHAIATEEGKKLVTQLLKSQKLNL